MSFRAKIIQTKTLIKRCKLFCTKFISIIFFDLAQASQVLRLQEEVLQQRQPQAP